MRTSAEIRSANQLISAKANAVISNDTIVEFLNPAFSDKMIELISAHAQVVIRDAVLTVLLAFLFQHDDTKSQRRGQMVRNGCQPGRTVLTGGGAVTVVLPKKLDWSGQSCC